MAKNAESFVKPYVVSNGRKFKLKDHDPEGKRWVKSKEHGKELLQTGVEQLCELQEKLYAQDRRGLLLIFQAMDAAGKDGTIKHVMSGVNPQGCQVYSFKAPSAEELDHDFLWRTSKALPERGRIGIFNRSYYEEVLVVRVHPEFLAGQKLPHKLVTKRIWKERFEDINAFERYLSRNGTSSASSSCTSRRRSRSGASSSASTTPEKNWKFSPGDVKEREHWDDYMEAYEDTIRHTATPDAPWFVVPADHKWFTRIVVGGGGDLGAPGARSQVSGRGQGKDEGPRRRACGARGQG